MTATSQGQNLNRQKNLHQDSASHWGQSLDQQPPPLMIVQGQLVSPHQRRDWTDRLKCLRNSTGMEDRSYCGQRMYLPVLQSVLHHWSSLSYQTSRYPQHRLLFPPRSLVGLHRDPSERLTGRWHCQALDDCHRWLIERYLLLKSDHRIGPSPEQKQRHWHRNPQAQTLQLPADSQTLLMIPPSPARRLQWRMRLRHFRYRNLSRRPGHLYFVATSTQHRQPLALLRKDRQHPPLAVDSYC